MILAISCMARAISRINKLIVSIITSIGIRERLVPLVVESGPEMLLFYGGSQ